MFGFIKKNVYEIINTVNAYNHTKCLSLDNQKCTA